MVALTHIPVFWYGCPDVVWHSIPTGIGQTWDGGKALNSSQSPVPEGLSLSNHLLQQYISLHAIPVSAQSSKSCVMVELIILEGKRL